MSHTLNSKSWHFWLANFGNTGCYYPEDTIDICSYIRSVVRGIFLLLAAIAVGIVILITTLYSLGNWFSVIFLDGYLISPVTILVTSLYSIIGFATYKANQHDRRLAEGYFSNKSKKEPGFLKLAYRKFKNKTCFMVDFK